MTTETFYPAASGDDGLLYGPNFSSSGTEITVGCVSWVQYQSFFRFPNITIPKNSIIISAYFKITANSDKVGATCNANLYFNDVDNAIAPTSTSEYTALQLTGAVGWNGIESFASGVKYTSPDISSILQPIINRENWASGQAVQLILKGNSSNNAYRTIFAYNYGDGSYSAELVISYYGLGELDESATASEVIDENSQVILDESATAGEVFDADHLQPFHGILDEAASASDEIDENHGALDENAEAEAVFEEASRVEISELAYVNDVFEWHNPVYDLSITENGYVNEDIDCPSQILIEEDATADDSIYSLMDGLDESATAHDQPAFVYDADISEDASVSDDFESLSLLSIQEQIDILDALSETLFHLLSLSENVQAWDTPTLDLSLLISEALAAADTSTVQICLLIADYINALDALAGQQNLTMSASDSIYAVDAVDRITIIAATLADAIAITDAPTFILTVLLADYMEARESVLHSLTGTKAILETVSATDAVVAEWVLSIAESITSTDTITPGVCVLISDYMAIHEIITGGAVSNQSISESLAVADSVIAEWVFGLIESLGVADALTMIQIVNLSETISLSDILTGIGAYGVRIQESAGISDYTQTIISLLISESLVATDSVSYLKDIYLALAETMGAADALVASLNVYLSLTDNMVAVDTASNTGVFGVTIQEGIRLDVSIEIDGEAFECYVLSTRKFLPSIYSGFNFNSYCEYQGRAFGANATGIFELTGDTDNGTTIHTGATLHESDFGMRNDKRFRKVYLGVSGTEPVMIMETGEGERIVYLIDDKGKVDASRSLHSRDWKLSIADFDTVDTVHLVPVILARGK